VRGDGKQEVKEKGKTINRQVGKNKTRNQTKKYQRYKWSVSVLIHSKLNRH
jgi:hypothetical protein